MESPQAAHIVRPLAYILALAGLGVAMGGCATSDPLLGVIPDGTEDLGGSDSDGGGSSGGAPGSGGSASSDGGSEEGGSGGATVDVMSGCGDGIVDATEDCDDGNAVPGDGCEADCTITCEPGAQRNPTNAHCYRVFATAMTWGDAEAACATWGGAADLGHLVSIADGVEQAFVESLLADDTWIGGGDTVTEGDYEWTDGTPWTYDLWAPGEPNDVTVEDCVFLRADGTWDDHDCAMMWPAYLCERRGAGTF